MSEEQSREYLAPVPFALFDAITLDGLLATWGQGSSSKLQWRRRALTSGSAMYEVILTTQPIGAFLLRASIHNPDTTYILAQPNNTKHAKTQLDMIEVIIAGIWAHYKLREEQESKARPIEKLPAMRTIDEIFGTTSIPLKTKRRDSLEPPARGASIDEWLDWRDRELARGRSTHAVSYKKLEELSGGTYKEDQFKKRGAMRSKKRG